MAKAVHSMIRVLDEKRSSTFYGKAFGLRVADRIDFDSFTLVYLSNPETEFELELTINKGRSEPYSLGDGYGHLAVVVDDLDAEHQRIEAAGLAPGPIRQIDLQKQVARFFFMQDPDGYKIEVIERGGRFR
ncbi:MAG TPA: VOC family protein [Hyphomicrobiaceae bacterium]|jgi:lactoylglutathione lyase|nr:VOC family protein [Hyphomicrobiaceae bacterium]